MDAGIRELKQNASAAVSRAAAGEALVVTDRGRPVARLVPLGASHPSELVTAGLAHPPRRSLADLPRPEGSPTTTLSDALSPGPRGAALLMAYHLDTSALVKLVAREPESDPLRAWLDGQDDALVSSDLARTELLHAVRRVQPEGAQLARQVLDTLTMLRLETGVFEDAARLDAPGLRSLDALHLALRRSRPSSGPTAPATTGRPTGRLG